MKLQSLAERIAQTKAKLHAQADELHTRLDEIDKAAPEVFARAHDTITAHQADIQGLEDGLRSLSNGGPPLLAEPSSSVSNEGSTGEGEAKKD
jgi:uncharacterized protein (DUF3084 family)